MGIDDDEDFPLADHPGPGGPKAGDPEMNRARDIMHLDVKAGRQSIRESQTQPKTASDGPAPYQVDPESPVAKAWAAFNESGGYDDAISQFDLFMAGWVARDSQ